MILLLNRIYDTPKIDPKTGNILSLNIEIRPVAIDTHKISFEKPSEYYEIMTPSGFKVYVTLKEFEIECMRVYTDNMSFMISDSVNDVYSQIDDKKHRNPYDHVQFVWGKINEHLDKQSKFYVLNNESKIQKPSNKDIVNLNRGKK